MWFATVTLTKRRLAGELFLKWACDSEGWGGEICQGSRTPAADRGALHWFVGRGGWLSRGWKGGLRGEAPCAVSLSDALQGSALC